MTAEGPVVGRIICRAGNPIRKKPLYNPDSRARVERYRKRLLLLSATAQRKEKKLKGAEGQIDRR